MYRSPKKRRTLSRRRPDSGTGRHGRGFTLIELVAVIVVAGIIFSIGSVLLGNVFSSYALRREFAHADWQAKIALERMTRELRAARSATAADLAFPSASEIRFVDSDGNNVCFYLNAGRIWRAENTPLQACGSANPQVLADNVTALTFRYWDNAAATTTTVTSVYYITVAINVVEGSYSSSFRTSVRPRNF